MARISVTFNCNSEEEANVYINAPAIIEAIKRETGKMAEKECEEQRRTRPDRQYDRLFVENVANKYKEILKMFKIL